MFGSGNFTIAGWFYLRATDDYSQTLFGHQYYYSSSYAATGISVYLQKSSGCIAWKIGTSYSNSNTATVTSQAYPIGEWFHVALVRSGTTVTLYYNGKAISTKTISGTVYQNTAASFKIGGNSSETSASDTPDSRYLLDGYIDEFIIAKEAFWTSAFDPYDVPWGTPDRKFQSGIVGRTNAIEGVKILRNLYLYNEGDECTDVSGGWLKSYNTNGSGGTFTKNASTITVRGASGADRSECGCMTANAIDFTDYSTINFEITEILKTINQYTLCILAIESSNAYYNSAGTQAFSLWSTTTGLKTVDVSEITGEWYVYVIAGYGTQGGSFSKIWLEP